MPVRETTAGRYLTIAAIWAALGLGSTGPGWAEPAALLPCPLDPGPTRTVAAVLDGETVRLDDRVEVRLIGALAPRPEDAGLSASAPWPEAEASRAALHAFVSGRSVSLAFAGTRNDRYGRVLAHLFVTAPETKDDIWVQGRLVEEGHARAYALPGSETCLAALIERERRARQASRGLWSSAAYQIRPADRPRELARYRHTFQIVRGRIERVRTTRGLVVVHLTTGERRATPAAFATDVRIVGPRQLWRGASLTEPSRELVGRTVLTRGWITGTTSPEIELVSPAALELEE